MQYGFLRIFDDLRARSESLTATETADLNQCYGQFSAHVVELLDALGRSWRAGVTAGITEDD